MNNRIISPNQTDIDANPRSRISNKFLVGIPTEGRIAEIIGTGENAKNSFVWISIRWCLWIGSLTSLAVFGKYVLLQTCSDMSLIDDLKSIWGIFMPVITLALGYAFGKGK